MAIRLNSSTLVTIFGGSGFIGRYIVQVLARTEALLRVAVRRPQLAERLQPLGEAGQIAAIYANVRDRDSVRRAVEDADAVIYLPGVLFESGEQTFRAVQVLGPAYAAEAARDFGVRALVHMSAIAADGDSPSAYARAKAEGEGAVLSAFPSAVILRPSVVFGAEDQFLNRFAAMARISPIMPLVGGGHTRFQPVYVGDVARAVQAALESRARPGAVYELGGPEVLTLREVFDRIAAYTGRKRLYLPVPFWLAKLGARVFGLSPNPPLTVDQVRLLQRDSVVSAEAIREHRTLQDLGVRPQPMEMIAPAYLAMYRPAGEFSRI